MAIPQEHELQPVDAHAVGAALARLVRDEPSVLRMWVSSHRGVTSLWLLTTPMGLDGERGLRRGAGSLFDLFPGTDVQLHLLNPQFYDELVPEELLPSGANEIALRVS